IPMLKETILAERGQLALDGLWALNLSGGLDEPFALKALEHPNPQVQLWTVRLLGDENEVSPAVAGVLIEMAKNAESVEVRSQLASTAKRLPAEQGLPVVRELLARSEDVGDIHLPLLLWWAIESKCGPQADQVMAVFEESAVWELPL